MRKFILIFALMLAVPLLAGCMGHETFAAADGTVALADMPPAPEGLLQPLPEGYDVVSKSESESLFTSGSRTIFVRYAVAPNASSIINTAIANDLDTFARQYAPINASEILEIDTFGFMGQNAFIITSILAEDFSHGRAGEVAVYAVAPSGDFFIMVSGYAPALERDGIRTDVLAFMGGFAEGTAEPDDAECDEQPEGRV